MSGIGNEKHWLTPVILFISFLTLSLVGVFTPYFLIKDRVAENQRETIKVAAELAAESMPGDVIERIKSPRHEDSLEAASLTSALNAYLNGTDSLTNLYVVGWDQNKNFYSLFGATKLGKSVREFKVFDPIAELDPSILKTIQQDQTTASPESVEDRWGSWLSASVPIKNSKGEVVAALVAEQSDAKAKTVATAIQYQLILCTATAVILSFGLTAIITRLIQKRDTTLKLSRSWLGPAMEITLLCLISVVVVDLGMALIKRNALAQDESKAMSQLSAISSLKTYIADEELQKEDRDQWFDALATSVPKRLLDKFRTYAEQDEATQAEIERDLEQHQAAVLKELNPAINGLLKQDQRIYRAVAISVAITIVSLFLLRRSSQRDRHLLEMQASTRESQNRYGNLVENLPIGLFILDNGKFVLTNAEWDRQVSVGEDESPDEAFYRAIHPDDLDQTSSTLIKAEQMSRPFRVQFRIVRPDGNIRNMESHGIPVYGESGIMKHLLAFSLDVTQRIQAQREKDMAYMEVEQKNKLLSSALGELEQNLESVVRALVKAVEAKDPYTAGHSERVMQYSLWLGEAVGLGPYEMRILELGTLVHDVGKIGIPDSILTKPDKLTDEEFQIIQNHPVYGENIIRDIGLFKECLPIVRWHHERLDGRGYPDGLKGDQIPVLVRISAIADIFDAMTSTRAYRAGMPINKVLSIMQEIADKGEIDSHLFAFFCQVVRQRGVIPQSETPPLAEKAA